MKDLYFLKYNDYFNRISKKLNTLSEYREFEMFNLQNINVNIQDETSLNQIVNLDLAAIGTPDYCVMTENGSNEIVARWFVLGREKITFNQYNLALFRDTLADFKTQIMGARSVIVKGTVAPDNPLIYNSENTRVNQIKTTETLLKDYTGMPWIVGYISQDVAIEHPVVDIKSYEQPDYQYEDISSHPFYKYKNGGVSQGNSFLAISYQKTDQLNSVLFDANTFLLKLAPMAEIEGGTQYFRSADKPLAYINLPSNHIQLDINKVKESWANVPYDTKAAIADANPASGVSVEEYNNIIAGQGKTITTRSGNYKYRLVVDNYSLGGSISNTYIDTIRNCFTSSRSHWKNSEALSVQQVNYINPSFHLVFEPADSPGLIKYQVKFSGKDLSNETSPYSILCMPYADGYRTLSEINDIDKGIALTKAQRLKLFQALSSVSNLVYDIQILPYCPISTITFDKKNMYNVDGVRTIPVYSTSKVGLVTNFYCAKSGEFSFRIGHDILKKDMKLTNECDMWRLVSPNYSSAFEFNASKFGIHSMPTEEDFFIKHFYVDCCYKPYQPYIHVAPEWGGLYGETNFKDARGLICSGDFSVDRVSDEWETYQYNNKNFQLQFDRQIETVETNRLINNIMGGAGIVGGLASEANLFQKGGMSHQVYGALLHAQYASETAGYSRESTNRNMSILQDAIRSNSRKTGLGFGNAITSAANLIANNIRTNEQIAASRDQFNFSNQNIQARPYGLTKVSVLNNNFKYFPFIEYYTCTDEEKEMVKDHITYDGMTVGKIGNIIDYLNINKDGTYKYPPNGDKYNKNYIRAVIIKMPENSNLDTNIITQINQELSNGVYFE